MTRQNISATIALIAVLAIVGTSPAVSQAGEQGIAAAVSPLPEELRESAAVMDWKKDGSLTELRSGSGDMICLADKAGDERFHAACYHRDLEPFMARGRELKAEGLERDDVRAKRAEEIEAGTLTMPDGPRALYSLTGKLEGYDFDNSSLVQGNRLFVMYVPYATEASTGLAAKPMVAAAPWLMDPGTPWAHVMIVQQVGEKPTD